MKRRTLLGAGLAAMPLAPAWAQAYPAKPIRWINPFPAGSPTDAVTRKLAEMLAPRIGQPIVVENKPGANGSIGTGEVVRAAPDGYTFGVAIADSLISVATLLKNPGYDARKDLMPLAVFSVAQSVLFANRQSGIRSVADLIQQARANPGKISYGSWGQGTLPQLIMTSIERHAGVSFLHVPYKGLAPIMQDLLGNSVQLSVGPPALVAQFMEKGQVQPVAVMGPERTPFLPQVPTFAEQGLDLPYLRNIFWTGLIAPKGLPPELARRWVELIGAAVKTPEFEKFLATGAGGQLPRLKGPEEFARDLAAEWTLTNDIIRSLGISPE
jgi:tripartite-type tricarboxylate transporter receptor subunit TctC